MSGSGPTRRALLTSAAAAWFIPHRALASPTAGATLDPTFFLLAALARAADLPGYDGGLPGWTAALDRLRPKLRGTGAAAMLHRLRTTQGLGFEAIPSLALHLTGTPEVLLAPRVDPWPPGLDGRWKGVDLPALTKAVSFSATVTQWSSFLLSQSPTLAPLQEALTTEVGRFDLPWLETWFGYPAPGVLQVHPGLLGSPRDYAVRRTGLDPAIAVVLSVAPEGEPFPRAPLRLLQMIARVYLSNFAKTHQDVLQVPMERLYGAVRERALSEGFGDWESLLTQSLIRAIGVRYLLHHDGRSAASVEIAAQLDAGFPWVLVLADTLASYEADRDRFPTFGDFAVELAALFSVVAGEEEDRAAHRPHVVSVVPDPASLVDPATTTLTITFDRPMGATTWSFVGVAADLPELGKPSFSTDHRSLTIPCRLTPGRHYGFTLNGEGGRGFRSADGVPLDPYRVSFQTR